MRNVSKNYKALVVPAWALLLLIQTAQAQFSQARLQAIGLTCALCSKAIHESLSKLPFVDSVRAEIKSSSFDIKFKSGMAIPVEALRSAVEESGFFVGEIDLKLSRPLTELERSTRCIKEGALSYKFLEESSASGSFQVLGKGFMTEKALKKIPVRYVGQMAGDPHSIFLMPKY